ncbi:hypothetical protein D3C71_1398830 [compost metagenome]
MRIARVVAGLVDDAVGRGEAGQGIDVGVGIVAFQIAMVQPQHTVLGQPGGQVGAERFAAAVRMTLVQALPGGQQGAGAVGLDAAAFQCERNALQLRIGEQPGGMQYTDQLVIQAGVELAAPAGEAEVQQAEAAIGTLERDRAGVAQPGVVVLGGHEPHAVRVDPVRTQARIGVRLQVVVGDDDHHRLEAGDGRDKRDVGVLDVTQAVGPVGVGVGPGDQDGGLGFPFGRKAERVVHDLNAMARRLAGKGKGVSGSAVSARSRWRRRGWRPRRSPSASRSRR